MTIDEAKALLEANGFTVLRTKSYNQMRERHRVAVALKEGAERYQESTRAWAVDCIKAERRLMKRCEFLYGVARACGASVDELRGES